MIIQLTNSNITVKTYSVNINKERIELNEIDKSHKLVQMKFKHEIWIDPNGLTQICLSGELGAESRSTLGPNSKVIHTFYAESHFQAMTIYYQYMDWGEYSTEFNIDYDLYDLDYLTKRAADFRKLEK